MQAIQAILILVSLIIFCKIYKVWKKSSLELLIYSQVGCVLGDTLSELTIMTTWPSTHFLNYVSNFLCSTFILVHINKVNVGLSGLKLFTMPLMRCVNPRLTRHYWGKITFLIALVFIVLYLLRTIIYFSFRNPARKQLMNAIVYIKYAYIAFLGVYQMVGAVRYLRHPVVNNYQIRKLSRLHIVIAFVNAFNSIIRGIYYLIINCIFQDVNDDYKQWSVPACLVIAGIDVVQAVVMVSISPVLIDLSEKYQEFAVEETRNLLREEEQEEQ